MKKLLRFAGVTLLALTIGVFGCGDDETPVTPVTPVAPPAPPPPPLVVTMAPASQMIGVGGTVVFAVTVSGGVAGEAASWTCASSDPSKATVTITSAGCAATAVAVGGVTITAAVTKSGATVNTAAGLTITEDTAERAFLFIASIKDSDSDSDEDDGVLSRTVNVELSVERGDQMLTQLSVLVDGVVAVSRTYGGGASVVAAAPEGEEGERAAQQAARAVVLSFNSAAYDTDTGVPDYLNGERTISAELTVVGSDEPLESAGHPHEFDNDDGVHVAATAPSESARASDGGVWYGGPGTTTLEITAIMVSYSGSSADAVTMQGFCGADGASKNEAPYEFAPDCAGKKKTTADAMPEFSAAVAGAAVDLAILNHEDDIFPINLDYAGPTAPVFKVNPNSREGGWINAAVNLTGKNGSSGAAKNGWLIYYDDDDGVGGYIPQLRYSTSDPSVVASARAATPSADPTLPAETDDNDDICFIVTAKDLLGNESAIPSASKSCKEAGAEGKVDDAGAVTVAGSGYGGLVTDLKAALKVVDLAGDGATDTQKDAVTEARKDLKDTGLRAGVDITAPTAEFARSSLDEDSREIDDEFVVEVDDGRDGSGIHTGTNKGAPRALVASLEIRDAEGTKCVIDNEPSSSTRLCGDPFKGLVVDGDLVSTTIENNIDEFTGYYTFTAQAQDKAGNKSEEISRVALNDGTFDARASLRVSGDRDDESDYAIDITLDDDLSVRDYYLAMSSPDDDAPGTLGHMRFTLGDVEQVDAFNAADLTTDTSPSEEITLPFLALQATAGADPAELMTFDVYVRDQRGADSENEADDASETGLDAASYPIGTGVDSEVTITLLVAADGSETPITDDADLDDGDDIDIRVTVNVRNEDLATTRQVDETDAPFKRIYLYAETSTDNDGPVHWRLIDSFGRAAYDDGDPAGEYVYETEINAGDLFAIVDEDGEDEYSGRIVAIGVQDDLDAVPARAASDGPDGDPNTDDDVEAADAIPALTGVVGLISTPSAEFDIDP